ncbi:Formin-like protein [Labeo rohita]|uniref:Formin-like protein n=1 Tax=Labeo rohita TaxID=84645 RepID=A0ABQ8L856_LABRO|nr:Formin-like protein [Labeo rohita]
MPQPESAPKMVARPQPEPPPARAAFSPVTSSARVAASPVCFAAPETLAVLKATPRSSATMDEAKSCPGFWS